jgi:Ser/Thr protein kinase RdoA (MazF antagonist)
VNEVVEHCLGAPVSFEELKHKPGRRLTLRARGPGGTAIVKLYRSDRVTQVAARVSALADGPAEPDVPRVLALDRSKRLLVLSDVEGRPLREAVLAGNQQVCARAGSVLASWHQAWAGARPAGLSEHTVERELATLADRAALAPREIGSRVARAVPELRGAWEPKTVVHRDLYEEQVLVGERLGLIDVDDAALGPPELDVGNLVAHLDLLELCSRRDLDRSRRAFLDGYQSVLQLDPELLERCRTLTKLRLACIHAEPRVLGGGLTAARA